ncbi:hypothetical protein [Massilia sp. Mn16-1_5]|uniref:hypothetical protein n=1 Tax=Massilia sp. Mn16-1_5 TaxID=2079199 RepID=UPI00109ECDFC|nr:hypothetical protein [Massilia sp. Mn16-1_5]THC45637.1 hypothetical protein C2862_03890 [Massilia sp. Mn16-1_5]
MSKLVPIRVADTALGVSTSTLRRWEATRRPVLLRTEVGQRRHDLTALCHGFAYTASAPRLMIAYARFYSHDQRTDLERQKQVLELYCARLYGSRSYRNQKLIEGGRQAVREAQC